MSHARSAMHGPPRDLLDMILARLKARITNARCCRLTDGGGETAAFPAVVGKRPTSNRERPKCSDPPQHQQYDDNQHDDAEAAAWAVTPAASVPPGWNGADQHQD